MTQMNQLISNFFLDSTKEIRAKTRRLAKKMADLFAESKYEEVQILLEEARPMRYSLQGCIDSIEIDDDKKNMLVQAGYNSAIIDTLQLYMNEVNIQKEIQSIPTQYKDKLLHILKKRGTLLHKDLAAELGVSASELTDLIRKMNSTSVKLINVEAVSKYKLYSLTPIANQYIKKHFLDERKSDKIEVPKRTEAAQNRLKKCNIIEGINVYYTVHNEISVLNNAYIYYSSKKGQACRKFDRHGLTPAKFLDKKSIKPKALVNYM